MAQPLITFKVTYPGPALEPSLLDISIISNSILNPLYPAGTLYDGWCLDPNMNIATPGRHIQPMYIRATILVH